MFALSGQKWGPSVNGTPSGRVYWSADYIDDLDFNRFRYSEAEFDQSLQNAFQAWEDVARIDFEFADAENPADITIGVESLPGTTVGLARYTFSSRPGVDEFESAQIVFDEDESWSPEGDAGTIDFFAVALHEIGHVIGLDHVDDATEILNPVISTDELGDGDIEGAQTIYGAAETAPAPTEGADIGLDPETFFDAENDTDPEAEPETEDAAADDGNDDAIAGVFALLGLGIIAVVGGAAGMIGGGALAAFGLLSTGGGGGGSGGAMRVAGVDDGTNPFDSWPTIGFDTASAGCPVCGDDMCVGCVDDGQDGSDGAFF